MKDPRGRKSDPSTVAFGKIIQGARERADITQMELARTLEVGQQTISRWEQGRMIPQYDKIPSIAKALGLDAEELVALAMKQAVESPPRDQSQRLDRVESRLAGMEEILQDIVKRLPPPGGRGQLRAR